VSATVTKALAARMGGSFFCGPGFDRTRPEACPEIGFQLKPVLPPTQLTDAALRLATAQRNLEAARVEAQAIEAARKQGLDGMAYVLNEMRKSGQLPQVVVVPSGTPVSVPAK
jgi:hypothetical protein